MTTQPTPPAIVMSWYLSVASTDATADADDSLYQARTIPWRVEDNDVAAADILAIKQFDIGKRKSQTVGHFADQDTIASHQCVFH